MEVNEGDPVGAANLEKIDHVVVVMLENRSFDHMLGHLSLAGRRPEIDGLRPGLANEYQGRAYPVHHLAATALQMDPDHSASAIDRQIADGAMSGFVASAAATLAIVRLRFRHALQDETPGHRLLWPIRPISSRRLAPVAAATRGRVAILPSPLRAQVERGPGGAVHVERHGRVLVRDLPDAQQPAPPFNAQLLAANLTRACARQHGHRGSVAGDRPGRP